MPCQPSCQSICNVFTGAVSSLDIAEWSGDEADIFSPSALTSGERMRRTRFHLPVCSPLLFHFLKVLPVS